MINSKCQPLIFDNKLYLMDEGGELKEILVDCSSTGRVNPHSKNKRMTNYLSKVYRNIEYISEDGILFDLPCDGYKMIKKANKLNYCSNYLEFAHLKDNTQHISYIESCHKSLCPTCNFFRARFNLRCFIDILTHFFQSRKYIGYPFLFLTLTVPSCSGADLPAVLDKMSRSWEKLTKSKEFSRAFVASSRSLEITINRDETSKSYMMFHPHYHIILVAVPDYFKHHDNSEDDLYLDQKHFLMLWQRAYCNHNFRSYSKWLSWYSSFWSDFDTSYARLLRSAPEGLITQVHVKKIPLHKDPDRAIQDILRSAVEDIKYPFKPDEVPTSSMLHSPI